MVGSHVHGSYFFVSSDCMSSTDNSKSKMLRFSSIRLCVTLLGSVTKCFCNDHRSRIWLGVF